MLSTLTPGDGAWVPVRLQRRENVTAALPQVYWAVQPLADTPWEPVHQGCGINDKSP